MDDMMSDLNERLSASCREALQQLDDIEAKLAGLHAAIERGSGPADEAWRPEAARGEPAVMADMRHGLSVPRGGRKSERAGRTKGAGFEPSHPAAGRADEVIARQQRCPRLPTEYARCEPLRS